MPKEIVLLIGDEEITAELLAEEAPETCRIVESNLPLSGILNHAKLVDREVFFQTPFFVDVYENYKYSERGDLAFWNGRTTLCIFYDDMVPLGKTPTFARVTHNIEGLIRESEEVWKKPGKRITIKAKEA